MCKWNNQLEKELLGFLISGSMIFLFLYIIAIHLQISETTETTTKPISSPTTIASDLPSHFQNHQIFCDNSNPLRISLFNRRSCDLEVQKQMAPVTIGVISTYLNKLDWYDILLLILLWPIGIIFNKTTHKLIDRMF